MDVKEQKKIPFLNRKQLQHHLNFSHHKLSEQRLLASATKANVVVRKQSKKAFECELAKETEKQHACELFV